MEQHPLTTRARRGDLIRVRDCQMTLLHKNPLPTEETSPREETSPTDEPLPTEENSPAESSLHMEGLKKFKSQKMSFLLNIV